MLFLSKQKFHAKQIVGLSSFLNPFLTLPMKYGNHIHACVQTLLFFFPRNKQTQKHHKKPVLILISDWLLTSTYSALASRVQIYMHSNNNNCKHILKMFLNCVIFLTTKLSLSWKTNIKLQIFCAQKVKLSTIHTIEPLFNTSIMLAQYRKRFIL